MRMEHESACLNNDDDLTSETLLVPSHDDSSIDSDDLSSDVFRLRRCEECDEVRYILRLAHSSSGYGGEGLSSRFLCHAARHAALDESGADAVDADETRGQLLRQGMGQA